MTERDRSFEPPRPQDSSVPPEAEAIFTYDPVAPPHFEDDETRTGERWIVQGGLPPVSDEDAREVARRQNEAADTMDDVFETDLGHLESEHAEALTDEHELPEEIAATEVFVKGPAATSELETRSRGRSDSASTRAVRSGHEIAGRYRLESKLGQGGMGEVYLAEVIDRRLPADTAIDDLPGGKLPAYVVVKVPRPKYYGRLDILECFFSEGQHQQRVRHDFVARVFEVGRIPVTIEEYPDHPGLPYIVTEFINGAPLDEYCITNSSELTVGAVIRLFDQVAEALDATMAMNIVHRDIKPQNILVKEPDGPDAKPSVRLLDFGLALDQDLSEEFVGSMQTLASGDPGESTERGGTPAYMAPEMWDGHGIGIAADIYALAIAVYMSLTRSYPYIIRGTDYRSAHKNFLPIAPSTYNPQFTQAIDDALMAGLAKNAAMRPERPTSYVGRVREALDAAGLLDKPLDWLTQHSMPSFADGDRPSFEAGTGLHARLWSVDDLQRLRHISLFRGLSKGELLTILNAGLLSQIPAQRVLFQQGDRGDRLYAVLEGEVEVFIPRPDGSGEEVLARPGAGAVFGELSLILGGERNASVRTLTNVRALVLGKAELDLLLARPQRASTALMLNIARSIGRTLQASQSRAFRVEESLRARIAELEAQADGGSERGEG